MIHISLALHLSEQAPFVCALALNDDACIEDALNKLNRQIKILPLENIYIISLNHQRAKPNSPLKQNDRIEVNQPLKVTPEALRQLRIAIKEKNKAKKN
jgi:putative ubiquitin-RnfH superfamily antitoxin RatB of RatAB toxin-antitoxin module